MTGRYIKFIALTATAALLTGCLEDKPTNYSCSGSFGVASLSIIKKKSATFGRETYEFCKREGNIEFYSLKHPEYSCTKTEYQMRLVFDPITGYLQDIAKAPNSDPNNVTLVCKKVD